MKMDIKSNKDIKLVLKNNPPSDSSQNYSCGHNLVIRIRSIRDGGSIRYIGKMNHPITKKRKEVTVGCPRELKLEDALYKWLEIKKKAQDLRCNPNKINQFESGKTLRDASNILLKTIEDKRTENYARECRYRFERNMLPMLDDMPIKNFESEGGVDLLEDMFLQIRGQDKEHLELERKCRGLMRRAFEIAQIRRWIKINPVITNRDLLPEQTVKHYPMLKWYEVPELIKRIECNAHRYALQQVLCTKFILLTGLRVGAGVRVKWSQVKEDIIEIDGKTSGLKRKKGKSDHIPHMIPLTDDLRRLIDTAKRYGISDEYMFAPITHSRYKHLDPSGPSNFIRGLGIINSDKEQFVLHGWRRTFLSSGQDVIKGQKNIIRKQLGHLPEGKVERAYDWSEHKEERRDFLEKWGRALIEMGLKV